MFVEEDSDGFGAEYHSSATGGDRLYLRASGVTMSSPPSGMVPWTRTSMGGAMRCLGVVVIVVLLLLFARIRLVQTPDLFQPSVAEVR